MSKLVLSHLSVALGGRVSDVSLELNSGKFHALIGPNGAGKSTILRAISRNLAFSGAVEFDGVSLASLSFGALAKILSYMPQSTPQTALNVYEMLCLGRRATSGFVLSAADHAKIEKICDEFRLNDLLNTKISSLSGGQRQKVAIASCLLQEPKILLLDEPISQLDPKNQYEMLELIRAQTIEKNLVTIAVLHDIQHALHYADEFVMLRRGLVWAHKCAAQIGQSDLGGLFDVSLRIFRTHGYKFAYFDKRAEFSG